MSDLFTEAKKHFDEQFRVRFNFDGSVSTSENGPGEKRRAVEYGGDKSTFTWKRFLSLEDYYNPSPNSLNPWSLKKWYKWGCRKFHLHNPFGKVALGNTQQLVYEVDQYLNAKNGLTINGVVQNTPMPWLVNDFTEVFKALTTGQRGTIDQATWDSWTIGPDAWFNPTQPIDVIVYIGAMADPGTDTGYKVYIDRWNALFASSATNATKRLKDSVAPIIDANCRIAFDAAVVSPGAIAGQNIPFTVQSSALQKSWWTFFTYVSNTIGKNRVYVESHPFRKNGMSNSYIGYNIIADDDWSYSPAVLPGPNGPYMTSEMGDVEFWRAIWQNGPASTPLISRRENGVLVKERYWFLNNCRYAVTEPTTQERRLAPAVCCNPDHNYYYYDIYGAIIAYHLLEKQNIRGETNERKNITKAGILVPNTILQVLPEASAGDIGWANQFGNKFKSSTDFISYLSTVMDGRKNDELSIYNPYNTQAI